MLKNCVFIFILVMLFLVPTVNASTISIINVTVNEDAYIRSDYPNTNYGDSGILASLTSSSKSFYTYLKFNTDNYSQNATINIYAAGYTSGGRLEIYSTSDDWDESTITWNSNRPSIESTTKISQIDITSLDNWYSLDVSSVVNKPGTYSFLIKANYGYETNYKSSEFANNHPYIQFNPYTYTDIISNNKTNNDTNSLIVNTGDAINFNISVPDSSNVSIYKWYVNKLNQNNNNPSFDFIVPSWDILQPSSAIWEIHTEVSYLNGTTIYREWLLSSLSISDAPDFIEYFFDRDNSDRTGYLTDPWGRNLSSYTHESNLINKGYFTGGDSSTGKYLSTDFDTTYGTFKFKVQNPGTLNIFRFTVTGTPEARYNNPSNYLPPSWKVEWTANEFHDYFAINSYRIGHGDPDGRFGWGSYIPISRRGLGQAPSGHFWKDQDWHEITIIHTNDGWWSIWDNGVLLPQTFAHYEDAFNTATNLQLISNGLVKVDCIEVYKDKYIYPDSGIYYGWYPTWWKFSGLGSGMFEPVDDEGINIFGRYVTLKSIADSINDDYLFTYNETTRTAVTNVDLSLRAGAALYLNDETLLFNTTSGKLDFNIKNGAMLNLADSTISTIGNNPMRWNLASSVSQTIFDPDGSRTLTQISETSKNNPFSDFYGRFIVENSIINNTENLFLDGAEEIIINNTIFRNHHSIDYGDYKLRPSYDNHNNKKYQSMGEKALWIVPRADLKSFIINNVSFEDPDFDVDLKVVGGEWIQNTTTFRNSDFSSIAISTKKATKYEYYINYKEDDENSSVSLLNCLFNESRLYVETPNSKIMAKYYVDVLLEDYNGTQIKDAKITITNDNSPNDDYKPQILYEYDDYIVDAFGPGDGGVWNYPDSDPQSVQYTGGTYKRWYNALSLDYSVTGANGHTPLPIENVNQSIVLTDFVLTNSSGSQLKTSFTYTLAVETPDSETFSLPNVDPDSYWQRENPSSPEYTIVAIIPNESSTPSLIGYAPYDENPIIPGNTIMFQTWTNQLMTTNIWKLDGVAVETDSQSWVWETISEGVHTVVYEGSNANGAVSQSWDINGGFTEEGLLITEIDPIDTTPDQNNGSTYNYTVAVSEPLTSSGWCLDGELITSDTQSIQHTWTSASTHNITFTGSNDNGTVSQTWVVNVNDQDSSSNSIIAVLPSSTQLTPGETFTLTIPITPATQIAGAQVDLLYDGSMATVTSVTESNLLNQDGATTLFNSGTINNAAGTVTDVYGSILGNTSVSSQGSLATISMTAGSTTGYLNLNLANIIISDADSAAVPYTLTNATILVDTAPVLDSIGAKSVDEDNALAFTTSASDVDGDSLTYTATNLLAGASFNTATGAFSWTPADGEAGTYVVTFEVTDGYLNDSENVTITVNNANNAPVITTFVPANSLIFNELDVITVGIIASDADGDALSYTIKIDGVTKSTSSNYVWETDYSSAGTHTIDITVSDGIEQVTDSRTITINDVRPRWDVNEDGTVNVLDISIIGQEYGMSVGAPYPRWDVNQDGGINVQDMTLTGSHFGETVA